MEGSTVNLRMALLLVAVGALDPPNLPAFLVQDVKRGRDPKPTGRVRIHALRGGVWRVTDPVDAASVEWEKLLDNDRIEVLS